MPGRHAHTLDSRHELIEDIRIRLNVARYLVFVSEHPTFLCFRNNIELNTLRANFGFMVIRKEQPCTQEKSIHEQS